MEAFTHKNARKFVYDFVNEVFEFALDEFDICEADKPTVIFSLKDDKSYFDVIKNRPIVRIALNKADCEFYFREYAHIKWDSEIGMFPCVMENELGDIVGNWKKYAKAVICHEMAHFIEVMTQSSIKVPSDVRCYSVSKITDEEQRPYHGDKWQFIYRILRNEFVNEGEDYE